MAMADKLNIRQDRVLVLVKYKVKGYEVLLLRPPVGHPYDNKPVTALF